MAGKLRMGQKELLLSKVMEMVKEGTLRLVEAAAKLKVSYRQAKRIYARYRVRGDAGIVHGLQGRPSNHRPEEGLRMSAVEAYRAQYEGFGPTFACEKRLEREGIQLSPESLRQLLLAEGLWAKRRRRTARHARRQPRKRFGELVQFDGSHRDWFEGRGLAAL